ncbi:isoamylase early set domain-containing protein [Yinghuangia sp. YIM S09857]|uniref:isoamylase early set domain-containing protein n=1 Tax=Yinghuangia sp. YIM S09857 TaxID=3436929 RepID=UPI003F52AB0B
MLERIRRKNTTQVTFVLPPDPSCAAVSVVGDFNEWTPGTHELTTRKDGSRAVTVALPDEQRMSFRYLAHGGHWFDEPDADGHDGRNSYLDLSRA